MQEQEDSPVPCILRLLLIHCPTILNNNSCAFS
jgi:hypothetical protein